MIRGIERHAESSAADMMRDDFSFETFHLRENFKRAECSTWLSTSLPRMVLCLRIIALYLHSRFHAINRFALTVILIQVEIERSVPNVAGVWSIEIIHEVWLQIGPVGNHIFVMWIEVNALLSDRFREFNLAGGAGTNIRDDVAEERLIGCR